MLFLVNICILILSRVLMNKEAYYPQKVKILVPVLLHNHKILNRELKYDFVSFCRCMYEINENVLLFMSDLRSLWWCYSICLLGEPLGETMFNTFFCSSLVYLQLYHVLIFHFQLFSSSLFCYLMCSDNWWTCLYVTQQFDLFLPFLFANLVSFLSAEYDLVRES